MSDSTVSNSVSKSYKLLVQECFDNLPEKRRIELLDYLKQIEVPYFSYATKAIKIQTIRGAVFVLAAGIEKFKSDVSLFKGISDFEFTVGTFYPSTSEVQKYKLRINLIARDGVFDHFKNLMDSSLAIDFFFSSGDACFMIGGKGIIKDFVPTYNLQSFSLTLEFESFEFCLFNDVMQFVAEKTNSKLGFGSQTKIVSLSFDADFLLAACGHAHK